MSQLIVPLILIAVSIPMIVRLVPRNRLYGFRTPYTFSSDDVWYRASRVAGIALCIAGCAWAAAAVFLPAIVPSQEDARAMARAFGYVALLMAVAISFWLVYRRRTKI
jgi:uncharacterized membrane protein